MMSSKQRSTLNLLNKYFVFVLRVGVAAIFLLAGITKLIAPLQEFIVVAKLWNVIPDPWVTIYAWLLPWVEVVAGLMLLFGFKHRWATTLIELMLISFLIGIAMNIARGTELENCGCFGGGFSLGETFKELGLRDLFLLAATLWVGFTKPPLWLSLDRWLTKR